MRKPCCEKKETTRAAWSKQEDEKLIDYIHKHGQGCWNSLPKAAGLRRCGKSCRLRWINYLRPDLKRGSIGEDEEDLIIRLHKLLGNRWSLIAGRLPGRTDNEVKNYWNSHLKKKLMINTGGSGTGSSARSFKVTHAPNKKFANYLNDIDVVKDVDEVSDHSMITGGNANGNMNGISSCLPDLNLDLSLSVVTTPTG